MSDEEKKATGDERLAPLEREVRRITVTPEIHERAVQYVADALLMAAERIGSQGAEVVNRRTHFGVPPNPAMEVQEVAAQMALWLAHEVHAGRIRYEA